MHLLTLKQKYELRVDLEDFENNTAFAKYADFSISPNAVSAEEDGYTLYVSGFEDGGAGTLCQLCGAGDGEGHWAQAPPPRPPCVWLGGPPRASFLSCPVPLPSARRLADLPQRPEVLHL